MAFEEVLVKWEADNGNLKNVMAENIELNMKLEKAVKESNREINKAFDNASKSVDGFNKEIIEGTKKQKEYGQEQDKTVKSTNSLTEGFSKLKGGFLAFTAAIGAAGGLKALISARLEINKQAKAVRALTDETKTASREITKEIRAIAKVYEKDFNEILIASNAVAKEYGKTQTEVLAQIRKGFKAGSDINGEFLDILREYPTQFRAAGLSADQMFKLINRSVKEGIYSDKGADVIKEGTLRLREMTEATKKALDGIGLSSVEIEKSLDEGSKTLFEVIQEVSAKLDELPPQSAKVGTAIADIFGGPGEDAGLRFITLLKDIDGELENVSDEVTDGEDALINYYKAVDGLTVSLTGGNGQLSKFRSGIINTATSFINLLTRINEIKASDELKQQQIELNAIVGAIQKTNVGEELRLRLLGRLQEKYPDFLKNLDKEKVTNEQLATRLQEVNTQLEKKILLQLREEELTPLFEKRLTLQRRELDLLTRIEKLQKKTKEERIQGALLGSEGVDPLIGTQQALDRTREKIEEVSSSIRSVTEEFDKLGVTAEETSSKIEEATVIQGQEKAGKDGYIAGLKKQLEEISKQIDAAPDDPKLRKSLLSTQSRIQEELAKALTITEESGYIEFLEKSIQDISEEIKKAPNDPALIRSLLSVKKDLEEKLANVYDVFLDVPESLKASEVLKSRIKERIEEIKNAVSDSINESTEEEEGSEGSFLQRLLGIDSGTEDEVVRALERTIKNVQSILLQDSQFRQKIAQDNIDALDRQISNQQQNLEIQASLAEIGLANNVGRAQEEIDRLNDLRNRELANKREALRAEQRLATVEQSVSLISSAANIFEAFSKIPFIGVPLAIASIGTMFAAFASSKARSAQLSQQEFFDGGFSEDGGFTGSGSIFGESTQVGKKPYKYHKQEYIANHENTERFKPLFQAMESGKLKGMSDIIVPSLDHYPGLKTPHVPFYNLNSLREAKSNEQAELMNRAFQLSNSGVIQELSQLNKTNEKHYQYVKDTGQIVQLPDGRLLIRQGQNTRYIKNNENWPKG